MAEDTDGATASLAPILTAIHDSGHPMNVDFVGVGITSSQLMAIGPLANGLYADVAGEEDALVNLSTRPGRRRRSGR